MTTPPVSAVPGHGRRVRPRHGRVRARRQQRPAKGRPDRPCRAELDNPPLRLLVGSDAYEYGREAWQHRIDTDEKSEALSRSADHDEAAGAWQRQRGSSLPGLHA